MNRQVRRIEEKKERKQEEAKAKAKAQRQARRRERREERDRGAAKKKDAGDAGGTSAAPADAKGGTKRRGGDPGRFSGALMIATIFFIALQAVTPSDGLVTTQVVAASFYLLFGYFAVLWMMRRDTERPVAIAIGIGLVFAVGTALSQWLQPGLELAPIMLALIVPLLVAGAFLGRLVFRNAPG